MKILVDVREASKNWEIIEGLKSRNISVETTLLEVGDYYIPGVESYIVERKTSTDLVNTLRLGRFWEQLRTLKSVENAEPLLLLESSIAKIKKFTGFSEESVIGLLLSVIFDWNIKIVFTSSARSTVKALHLLCRRATKGKEVKVYPIRVVPRELSLDEQARAIIEGFPFVGASHAIALLKHFKTVRNIVNASLEDLMQVKGIGRKIAGKIIEVANHVYEG